MYCTYCGSKSCAKGTRLCVMSPQARNLIIDFLEATFVESSHFNKSYTFVPTEEWDSWAISHNLPTQEELLSLYPEEDLHSLLYLVLDEVEISPELRSFFHEPVFTDETEMFSEFSNKVLIDVSGLRRLTKDEVVKYTGRKVKNIPRPTYVESLNLVSERDL